jgi:hypothetical protein
LKTPAIESLAGSIFDLSHEKQDPSRPVIPAKAGIHPRRTHKPSYDET